MRNFQSIYPHTSVGFLDSHAGASVTSQKRNNEHDGVSNDQRHDCLLNPLFKAQLLENLKAPRHWPLWGKFIGDRWHPPPPRKKKGGGGGGGGGAVVTRKMFPFDDVTMNDTRTDFSDIIRVFRVQEYKHHCKSCPYPEPVYTGWSSVHWNATGWPSVHWDTTGPPSEYLQGTLEHNWKNLVETAPHWNATGEN